MSLLEPMDFRLSEFSRGVELSQQLTLAPTWDYFLNFPVGPQQLNCQACFWNCLVLRSVWESLENRLYVSLLVNMGVQTWFAILTHL